VAGGKAITERTRLAREAQKKATSKVAVIIENHKEKETPGADTNTESESTRNVLTTTQWLSVSIFASMIGIYYKRGEIKRVFSNRVPQTPCHHRLWMQHCRLSHIKEKASALWIEKCTKIFTQSCIYSLNLLKEQG